VSPAHLHPRNDAQEDSTMDDDRAHADLVARRAHLQATVFGAAGARATASERESAVAELRRVDAQLAAGRPGGSARRVPRLASPAGGAATVPAATVPPEAVPPAGSMSASAGSSATWLAAVAEAKLATWTARSEAAERHAADLRSRRAEEASAPLAGEFQFAPFGGADVAGESGRSGHSGHRGNGDGDGDGGDGDSPSDRVNRSHRFHEARARLTPVTVALACGVVLVATGVGFGVGANVASERAQEAGEIRASAGDSNLATPTPTPDDDAADWRALASQQALAEFSRNQLSGDLPPDSVSDDHFRADSFRLLLTGSIADWTGRVYAAKDIEGEICVVLVQPDSSYSAGCATPDQFARGGVQVTTNVSITIRADEDGSESTITGVTATWPANGMTGLRFSSARSTG
jgi:hypothetical protein